MSSPPLIEAAVALALLLPLACASPGAVRSAAPDDGAIVYHGAADASAAVALDSHAIVVADDETNVLRVYDVRRGGAPVSRYDLSGFLGVDAQHPEADIEAAARVGDRIYWITSHGPNKNGKHRPSRHRFFATAVGSSPGEAVTGVGQPYSRLALDLTTELGLEGALNIEALAAAPDGTLYVGLRNPLEQGRAIVMPLLNPGEIVDSGATPRFGEPILWDLGGLGVRSLEYSGHHASFFLVAGAQDDGPGAVLYRWSGAPSDPPARLRQLDGDRSWEPEAIVVFEDSARLFVLSDDGSVRVPVGDPSACLEDHGADGSCPNKRLRSESSRTFRGFWLDAGADRRG